MTRLRAQVFQHSLQGGRSSNQDRLGWRHTDRALLMVLCDGLGGHEGGELAAEVAVRTLMRLFQMAARPRLPRPGVFLDQALRQAHQAVCSLRQALAMAETPRSTVVACVVQDGRACWAHAGDARLYHWRSGELIGRTWDHSSLGEQQRLGLLDDAALRASVARNHINNCLGSPLPLRVEISAPVRLMPDDVLLLCSDGFWSGLDDAEITLASQTGHPLGDALPELMQRAVQRGGARADNTSVLALRWQGGRETLGWTDTLALPPLDERALSGLDDLDIDQAIRDINHTIRQRTQR